jgi:hypothetical protein
MKVERIKKWSGNENDINLVSTFNSVSRPLQYFEIAHLCNDPESFKFINQLRNDQTLWLSKYTIEEQEYIKKHIEKEKILSSSSIKRYIKPCPYIKCKQRKGDEIIEIYKNEKLKDFSSQLALECNIQEQKLVKHKQKISKLRIIQLQLEKKLEELDEYKNKTIIDNETQLYREMIYFQEKISKAKELFNSLVNTYSQQHPQHTFTVKSDRILNDTPFDITCKNIEIENGVQGMTRVIEKINFVPRLNLLDIKLQEATKPVGIPGTFLHKSPRNIRNQYKGSIYGCSPGKEQLPYIPKRSHTGVYEFDETGQKRWSCCLNTNIISDGCNDDIIIQQKINKKDNTHKHHRDGSICTDLESVHGSIAKEIPIPVVVPVVANNSTDWYPRAANISAAEWSSTLRNYSRNIDRRLDYDDGMITGTHNELLMSLSARDSYHSYNTTTIEKYDNNTNKSILSNYKEQLPSKSTISSLAPSSTKAATSPRVKNMRNSLKFMRSSFSQMKKE